MFIYLNSYKIFRSCEIWRYNVISSKSRSGSTIVRILKLFNKYQHSVRFLQLGANDGKSNDIISNYVLKSEWEGILVEPVPYIFEDLRLNYEGIEGLIFENIAISETEEEKVFYFIDQKDLDEPNTWLCQVGSFKKEHVQKHVEKAGLNPAIIKSKVLRTNTTEGLLRKHKMLNINLLLMDLEGYDYTILTKMNYNIISPKIIIFENKHMSKREFVNCSEKLNFHNYHVLKEGGNSIAMKD